MSERFGNTPAQKRKAEEIERVVTGWAKARFVGAIKKDKRGQSAAKDGDK